MANPTYEDVKSAIDNTIAKVEEAANALNNGADNETVIKLVSDARQIQKDIANNVLDVKRNQTSSVLNKARAALKNNDLASAKETLKDATSRYQEIDRLYAANH